MTDMKARNMCKILSFLRCLIYLSPTTHGANASTLVRREQKVLGPSSGSAYSAPADIEDGGILTDKQELSMIQNSAEKLADKHARKSSKNTERKVVSRTHKETRTHQDPTVKTEDDATVKCKLVKVEKTGKEVDAEDDKTEKKKKETEEAEEAEQEKEAEIRSETQKLRLKRRQEIKEGPPRADQGEDEEEQTQAERNELNREAMEINQQNTQAEKAAEDAEHMKREAEIRHTQQELEAATAQSLEAAAQAQTDAVQDQMAAAKSRINQQHYEEKQWDLKGTAHETRQRAAQGEYQSVERQLVSAEKVKHLAEMKRKEALAHAKLEKLNADRRKVEFETQETNRKVRELRERKEKDSRFLKKVVVSSHPKTSYEAPPRQEVAPFTLTAMTFSVDPPEGSKANTDRINALRHFVVSHTLSSALDGGSVDFFGFQRGADANGATSLKTCAKLYVATPPPSVCFCFLVFFVFFYFLFCFTFLYFFSPFLAHYQLRPAHVSFRRQSPNLFFLRRPRR